jgi:hypothetical protein
VAERIDDLAVAVAPEGVLQRLEDLGPGVDRALPERIGVVGGQRQSAVGTSQREW